MNLRRIVCSALVVSGLANAAWARDICLEHPADVYIVLRKVKSLRPGTSIPLNGFFHYKGVAAAPIDGSAMMKADGTVRAAIVVHGIADGTVNRTYGWTTDTTFAGMLFYDSDGDLSSDGAAMFNAIDCKTVPLP
jgi:hypothetical protein